MMETIKRNKIIFIAVGALAAVFLFINTSGGGGAPTVIRTSTGVDAADQEMIRMLRKMQKITLDDTIFSDPAFASLQDFSRAIEKEPQSRRNPFAPPETEQETAVPEQGAATDTPTSTEDFAL